MHILPKNKLIRDGIPQSIIDQGRTPNTRILDDRDFEKEIFSKLVDEAKEVTETIEDPEHLSEEIADVLEVIDAIVKTKKLNLDEIQKIKAQKRNAWGGFDKKVYLDSTVEKD